MACCTIFSCLQSHCLACCTFSSLLYLVCENVDLRLYHYQTIQIIYNRFLACCTLISGLLYLFLAFCTFSGLLYVIFGLLLIFRLVVGEGKFFVRLIILLGIGLWLVVPLFPVCCGFFWLVVHFPASSTHLSVYCMF